jgi:hypothetical protein
MPALWLRAERGVRWFVFEEVGAEGLKWQPGLSLDPSVARREHE